MFREGITLYGYVYETVNLINGKKYIGMHKSSEFDEKYKGSGVRLGKAFDKYGIENFVCRILKECSTKDELCNSERELILQFDAVNNDNYYNIADGGQGGDTFCGLKGVELEQLRDRRSVYLSTKGRIWINNGHKEKMIYPEELEYFRSQGFVKGKIPFTEEHKRRIGRPGINLGRRWSKSQSARDKVKGVNNPMYGSKYRWVNDGIRNYRWDLDKDIPAGYKLGKIRRNTNA